MVRLIQTFRLMISFLFSIALVASSTSNSLPLYFKSICGRSNGYLSIRFPFRIVNIEPKSIGYPGFDVFCDSFNNTLLHLPNLGNLSVQVIDYKKQHIVLTDPNDCLAQKLLLGLDLSHSPFRFENGYSSDNFSFYNCSESNENYTKWLQKKKISCLSTVPNHAIIGGNPDFYARLLEPWCDVIGNIRLLSNSNPDLSRMDAQLLLAWVKPSCGLCEGNITRCVFKNDTSLETMCVGYDTPIAESRQLSTKARYAIGISVGLGVPAILIFIVIIYKKIRSRRRAAVNLNDGSPSGETD